MNKIGAASEKYVVVGGVVFIREEFVKHINIKLQNHIDYCELNQIELISSVFKSIEDFKKKICTMHIITKDDLNMNAIFGFGSNLTELASKWKSEM